ncbi:MAG: hypothetical protein EPO21_15300 [Chloroflexota bacterium]|nr:MAG: hypothetical protein EPO21_15300 [Chloroflexota bacterium]
MSVNDPQWTWDTAINNYSDLAAWIVQEGVDRLLEPLKQVRRAMNDDTHDLLLESIDLAARLGYALGRNPSLGSFEDALQDAIRAAGLQGYKPHSFQTLAELAQP